MTYKVLFFFEILLNFPAVKHLNCLLWQGRSHSTKLPLKKIKGEIGGFMIITSFATAKRKTTLNFLVSQRTCNV